MRAVGAMSCHLSVGRMPNGELCSSGWSSSAEHVYSYYRRSDVRMTDVDSIARFRCSVISTLSRKSRRNFTPIDAR